MEYTCNRVFLQCDIRTFTEEKYLSISSNTDLYIRFDLDSWDSPEVETSVINWPFYLLVAGSTPEAIQAAQHLCYMFSNNDPLKAVYHHHYSSYRQFLLVLLPLFLTSHCHLHNHILHLHLLFHHHHLIIVLYLLYHHHHYHHMCLPSSTPSTSSSFICVYSVFFLSIIFINFFVNITIIFYQ